MRAHVNVDAEQRIREAFSRADFETVASSTLKAYGDQIFSFIATRLHNQSDAEEAFSMFAEDLWVGLPKFSWRCSMRTWCYTLARNAVSRYARAPSRLPARNIQLSSQLIALTRSATAAYQQTAVKDRMRALREQLDPDDQLLLVLRVNRNMSWQDLAMTMLGDIELSEEVIAREAARLRQAFTRIKTQLRRLAQQAGLLDDKA